MSPSPSPLGEVLAADVVRVAPSAPRGAVASIAANLVDGYDSEVRRYHTLTHARLVRDDAVALASRFDVVEPVLALAAWFHDVVYERRPGHDERASAELLSEHLDVLGRTDLAARGRALIEATIGHDPGDDVGLAVLVDADLGVLAAPPAAYVGYVKAVRAEYADVPTDRWRQGRAAVLRSLLARPRLFALAVEREAPARANLTGELAGLDGA